jgi:hypothetical protein
MVESSADYSMLFRRLSDLPEQIDPLRDCFYLPLSEALQSQWNDWLLRWRAQWPNGVDPALISAGMRRVNPAITWREWLIAPAYQHMNCIPTTFSLTGSEPLLRTVYIVLASCSAVSLSGALPVIWTSCWGSPAARPSPSE